MSTSTENLQFEAEVREVLDLMIHSLYTNREIFLRELISNSSDALDRQRYLMLTNPDDWAEEKLSIRLETDDAERTLTIIDNGIGMTRDELISSLGTIARSGTKNFLREMGEKKGSNAPELIGQFGVGFYSSFMVAERVVVETRAAGTGEAWRWSSEGTGEYSIEEIEKHGHGTRITLHLRELESEDGEPAQNFLSEYTLRDIVRRYSDFVEYPIEMDVERTEPERDAEGNVVEGGESTTTVETEVLNSMRPLWARDKNEITEEDHAEFYKHLTHDWQDPLEPVHFKAEGTLEFTALVYIPSQRPFDLFDGTQNQSKLSLYVRRVFITNDCEDLLPSWLRFVKGIVDSSDLPLNVSRETLQENRIVKQIGKRLTGKVLDSLAYMCESEREKFEGFWANFGSVLKEGVIVGDDDDGRVTKLLLFESTKEEEGPTTLAEYVERMPEGQDAIYVLTGPDRAALESSPHLEVFREKGYEVLFWTDPADEWLVDRLRDFEDTPVRSITKGNLDLDSEEERESKKQRQEEARGLLDTIQKHLDSEVKEVRLSTRLKESPAVLVTDDFDMTPQMQRILSRANQTVTKSKRILELNPEHELFGRLEALYAEDTESTRLAGFSELLFGQALLFEGAELPDPGRFAKLLTDLMVGK